MPAPAITPGSIVTVSDATGISSAQLNIQISAAGNDRLVVIANLSKDNTAGGTDLDTASIVFDAAGVNLSIGAGISRIALSKTDLTEDPYHSISDVYIIKEADLPSAAGTYTLDVATNAACQDFMWVAFELTGANQTPDMLLQNSVDFTDLTYASRTVTTVNADSLVVDFWGMGTTGSQNFGTADTGQTEIANLAPGNFGTALSSHQSVASVGNVTFGWTAPSGYSWSRHAVTVVAFPPPSGTVLSVDPIGQAQTVDAITLTQHHLVAVAPLNQAQGIDAASLVQHNVVAVAALDQAQSLGSVPLTQNHVLAPVALSQSQVLASASLTQRHVLAPDPSAQAQAVDTAGLLQRHVLAPDPTSQAQAVDGVSLTVSGTISISGLVQGQTIDAVALTQRHQVVPASLSQAQQLDASTISSAGVTVAVVGLSQAQVIGAANLIQHNVLVVDDIVQQQLLSGTNFGGAIGWLRGNVVIVAALGGEVTVSPAIAREHAFIAPALSGTVNVNEEDD